MSERSYPELNEQECRKLRDVIDSIPDMHESLQAVLEAWKRGTGRRMLRRGKVLSTAEIKHEKKVACCYKRALAVHFSGKKQRRTAWSCGTEFISSHFEETPSRSLETIQYCLRADSPEKADTSKKAILFTVVLPIFLLFKIADLPLLLSWLLADITIISAVLGSAKSIRCFLIRRHVPEMEALEAYCDVIAGSVFQALPKPLWAALVLLVALSVVLCFSV